MHYTVATVLISKHIAEQSVVATVPYLEFNFVLLSLKVMRQLLNKAHLLQLLKMQNHPTLNEIHYFPLQQERTFHFLLSFLYFVFFKFLEIAN